MVLQIRALRERAGLSQGELAENVGVLQNSVSQWESETVLPRTRDLPQLAQALGCSIADLFVDPGSWVGLERADLESAS